MSDSNRGERSQDLIAGGLVAVALFAAVVLAYAIGGTLGINSGRDQVTAREHYENTKQDNLRACIGREGAAAVECVSEAIEAAQEQSDSRQDLYAQRDMSRWAFWLLILTGITVAITAVGVWFVKRTLDATLVAVEDTGKATDAMVDANRIARENIVATKASERPYLFIEASPVNAKEWLKGEGEFLSWEFKITNVGRTPALIESVGASINIRIVTDAGGLVRDAQFDSYKPPKDMCMPLGGRKALTVGSSSIYTLSKQYSLNIVVPETHFEKTKTYADVHDWIWLIGLVTYQDVWGQRHEAHFCFVGDHDPNSERFGDKRVWIGREWGGPEFNFQT